MCIEMSVDFWVLFQLFNRLFPCPKMKSIKEVAFLENRLFSSQSELFESRLNCSDWKLAIQKGHVAGFFPANQNFLKTFQIALIGWIKAGPPKKPHLF